MKKNLVLATILFLMTIYAAAQTCCEYNTPYGKRSHIIKKEGKHLSVSRPVSGENITNYFPEISDDRVNETINKLKRSLSDNEYHLTIHFDKPWPFIEMYSDLDEFYDSDFTFSDDDLTAEIDLPENTYDIIFHYEDWEAPKNNYYILLNDFNITEDIDTTISFEAMAKNKILIRGVDENGQLIVPDDPSLLLYHFDVNIEFSEGDYSVSSSYGFAPPYHDYLFISDVDPKFKIIMNQCNVKHGRMYAMDLGQFEGIYNDITLENDPADYKVIKMVMHDSPASSDVNYLTVDCGAVSQIGYSASGSFLDNYPSFDKDTLVTYLSNKLNLENWNSAYVPIVSFWDGVPSPQNRKKKRIVSQPVFINENDSIVFCSSSNVNVFSPQYPDNSIADIGKMTPYIRHRDKNNVIETNTVFSDYNVIEGQISGRRWWDNSISTFEIQKNESILSSGFLDDFEDPFVVTDPGVYSFIITDSNYIINELQGCIKLNNTFDLSKSDANAPIISDFNMFNSKNIVSNNFTSNESATLLFRAYDYDWGNYQTNLPASAKVYFKKHNESDWIVLSILKKESIYTGDLSPALSQFNSSGHLDLKIVVSDEAGNSTTHIWRPLAFVHSTVGIPETSPVSATASLRLYPNPVTDVLSIDYSGSGPCSINILNAQGKLVYKSIANENEQYINLKSLNLAKGIYIIQLISDSKTITEKIIYKN